LATLVTGSQGFIARRLLSRFLLNYIPLDIQPEHHQNSSRYIQHDIRKPLPEISEVENVVHLAAIPGFKACDENRSLAWQVNVEGTRNICEFARRMDVEKLIFASTCGCYRNKKYYAVTKLEGEQIVSEYSRKYGFDASILRFANIYGLGFPYKKTVTALHKFLLQALMNQPITVYGGNQKRDFIYIDDVCRAILYCLNNEVQEIRYVGTRKFTTILELANLIKAIFKHDFNRGVVVNRVIDEEIKEKEWTVPKEHYNWNWKARVRLKQGIRNILSKLC